MFLLIAAAITTGSLQMLCPASAHAQGGVPLWRNFSGGNAIAVDGEGNAIVTGRSLNDTNYDHQTIKYSSAGIPAWTNRFPADRSSGNSPIIAVDASGNVFVAGNSAGNNGFPDIDIATIKYSSGGVSLWTNRYNGPANSSDAARAIAVDSSGNVVVAGDSYNGSNRDYTTIKYSNDGVPLWINLYDGPNGEDNLSAMAVDGLGNVFVTGSSWVNGGGDVGDYATVAYSSAGDLLWVNTYNGPSDNYDAARAIAVDRSGNVFVTGESWGILRDYATIKYSNVGVPIWTNRYNGPASSSDDPIAVAVDASGNVFVTGQSYGASGSADYATVAYSNAGVPLWTRRYANGGASAIAVDSSGNVIVAGYSSPGGAVIAYSSPGMPIWTNRYNVGFSALALDRSGNVFVGGSSRNGTNYDYVTIKYSSSVPPPRLDFQKLSNELVLSWTNAGFNLQSAPAVTGTFTNLPGATSPHTNPISGVQQFFRLKGN